MKIHKYQPGSFIEVDDMAGGRRVGMVCKDGVTFWDLLDSERCTPLTIHPSMNPQELGNLVQFQPGQGGWVKRPRHWSATCRRRMTSA